MPARVVERLESVKKGRIRAVVASKRASVSAIINTYFAETSILIKFGNGHKEQAPCSILFLYS